MNYQSTNKVAKEAVAVLSDSQDVLQLIITNIPLIMFWKDTQSVFRGCNLAFTKLSGITDKDIIGKTDYDLISKEQSQHMREIDKQILDGEIKQYCGIEKISTPYGKDFWIDISLVPLYDQNGVIKGILGTGENITEKKRLEEKLQYSEEKYKNLIEFTRTGYVIMDDHLNILEANQTFMDIVGIDTNIIGKNPRTWVDYSDVEKFDKAFASLLTAERKFINDIEIDFYDGKTKRQTSTAVTANLIENGSNKIFCLVRDISERRTEEQRKYISVQKNKDRIKQNIQGLRERLKQMKFK